LPTKNPDPFSLAKYLEGNQLINGEFVKPASGEYFEVKNPATQKLVAKAANGDKKDVDKAVAAAKKAQLAWEQTAPRQRGKLVAECGRVLQDYMSELASLTSLETGKAIRTESSVEASLVADMFTFYGGLGSELKGTTVPFRPTSLTFTERIPVGVVAAIIPWNAPMLLMALKVAPALVAGNSVVLKTAEEAPFGVLRIAEILNKVLPPGLLNVVSGFGESCGDPLVKHPDVDKITFTGSVDTGKIVYKACAEKLAPLTVELGGKSPLIVMEDADIERAVTGAIAGMRFTRQGQSYTAASRMFVHAAVYDEFVAKLTTAVNKLKMGNPLDQSTDMGCIVSKNQYEHVKRCIEEGKKEKGVKVHEMCELPTDSDLKDGYFIRPVIFSDMTNAAAICRKEIFGPVTCIIKYEDFDDMIRQANDTEFGLAAYVWTNNLAKGLQAVRKIKAGIVQINQNDVVQANLPVGGLKCSGLGIEGTLEAMIEHFTHNKTISINTL